MKLEQLKTKAQELETARQDALAAYHQILGAEMYVKQLIQEEVASAAKESAQGSKPEGQAEGR